MSRLKALGAARPWQPLRRRTANGRALGRRLLHFWIVWTVLLLVHEGGHALTARYQGFEPERITVGVGPVLWRGGPVGGEFVLRLLPLAGLTEVREAQAARRRASEVGARADWARRATTLSGGVLATMALVLLMAGVVAARERGAGRRCLWGRIVIADAMVLSVFNLLPVPPLDGGRAMLSAVSAWRGTQLSADALFWFQVGGLALAVVPMALWTSWTSRIDAFALGWRAPERRAPKRVDSRQP